MMNRDDRQRMTTDLHELAHLTGRKISFPPLDCRVTILEKNGMTMEFDAANIDSARAYLMGVRAGRNESAPPQIEDVPVRQIDVDYWSESDGTGFPS